MVAITTTSTITDTIPALGRKCIIVETPNTADTGDTIEIVLSTYGISTFLGIIGFEHTTENSVVTTEAPTTAVSSGTLTITIGGSSDDNEKRVYFIFGK
jgi:hypothetical protein